MTTVAQLWFVQYTRFPKEEMPAVLEQARRGRYTEPRTPDTDASNITFVAGYTKTLGIKCFVSRYMFFIEIQSIQLLQYYDERPCSRQDERASGCT